MSKAYTKSQRMAEIPRLLQQYPDGISKAELAEILGTDRSTVHRDIEELEANGLPIAEIAYGRFTLDSEYFLSNLQLNSAESLVLHLAARRVARQSSHAIPAVLNALEKLSLVLRQPMMQRLQATIEHASELPADPGKQAIFETLVQAWTRGLCVQIGYRGLHAIHTQTHTLAPYLFEPSPWNESTYIIGFSQQRSGLAVFKFERIERATLTTQPYTIPEEIDSDLLLRYAWGIWTGEDEPTRVVLRFSSYVARRVRESRWHPTQTMLDLPTGGIEWSAGVAEPQEMLPWIRGWGADVEVIAPTELRDELAAEARRLARLYGIGTASPEHSDDKYGLNDTLADFLGGSSE